MILSYILKISFKFLNFDIAIFFLNILIFKTNFKNHFFVKISHNEFLHLVYELTSFSILKTKINCVLTHLI